MTPEYIWRGVLFADYTGVNLVSGVVFATLYRKPPTDQPNETKQVIIRRSALRRAKKNEPGPQEAAALGSGGTGGKTNPSFVRVSTKWLAPRELSGNLWIGLASPGNLS